MAEVENAGLRPRLPMGWDSHCLSLSGYTYSEPRRFTAKDYLVKDAVCTTKPFDGLKFPGIAPPVSKFSGGTAH